MNFKFFLLILLFCLFHIAISKAQCKVDTIILTYDIETDIGFFILEGNPTFSIPTSIDTLFNKKFALHALVKFNQIDIEDPLIFKEITHIFLGIYEIGVYETFDNGVQMPSDNEFKNIDYEILYNEIYSFIKTLFLTSVIINKMNKIDEYYFFQMNGVFVEK